MVFPESAQQHHRGLAQVNELLPVHVMSEDCA